MSKTIFRVLLKTKSVCVVFSVFVGLAVACLRPVTREKGTNPVAPVFIWSAYPFMVGEGICNDRASVSKVPSDSTHRISSHVLAATGLSGYMIPAGTMVGWCVRLPSRFPGLLSIVRKA